MSATLKRGFSFATGKHDEINLFRKVTRFKNVPLSAEWTVNFSRSFIVNKTSRQSERGTIKVHVMRLPSTHSIKRIILVKKTNQVSDTVVGRN